MTRLLACILVAGTLTLLLAPVALAGPVLPAKCNPFITGPDLEEQFCYDANDLSCPLYTLTRYKDDTAWHKHCIGQ